MRACGIFFREAGSEASHNTFLPETNSEGLTLLDGHCLRKRYSSNSTLNLNIKKNIKIDVNINSRNVWTRLRRNPSNASRCSIVLVILCLFPIFILKVFYLRAHASNGREGEAQPRAKDHGCRRTGFEEVAFVHQV